MREEDESNIRGGQTDMDLYEEDDEDVDKNEVLENLEAETLRLMVADLWTGMARLESCNVSLQQQADRGANYKMKFKIAQEHIERQRQWQAVEEMKIRNKALNDAIEAVDAAGGDNEDYHIEAIKRKFGVVI